ncbi:MULTISPECIES: activator of Hsp90 ATPase 1 family protein [Bacillus]|uniref:Activator of Hsp90 ATPase 1 family protein n=1 Tax=Bacillus cereus TaxID=1396 RepID=A0A9X6GCL4_BACCE|nr:activator of Hsp90 ATPase 1 family protein [Bacillus cereus]OOR71578.1 activator of Hsp90 ATPase 1 family protein [Bacillus cereus]
MIAEIRKLTDGYIVKFERQFPYTAEEVWSVLTENSSFINIDILECQLNSVLEFTWDKDRVRFEIHNEENGTLLLLKEYIHELTDHTPRDVAGWHICLNLFSFVLEGEEKEFSKDEWQQWFEIYKDKIHEVRG